MIISAGEALVDLVPQAVPGGGPMNTAVATARLGVATAFLGRVSTDAYGDTIWQHLADSGVDMALTQRGDEPTCRAEVVGDPPVFIFHGDSTADAAITSADLTVVGPGPHILHGGTLSMFRQPGAEFFASIVETHDGLVSLDPNVRPQVIGEAGRSEWMAWLDRWLDHVGLFRVSDADLAWIWPDIDVETVLESLFARGVAAVIVTTSGGATAYTPAGSAFAASQRVAVVDTVGAGDSFCGGVLTMLHEANVRTNAALADVDLDHWRTIVDFAGRVAAVTVSRAGANPPYRHEVAPAD